VPRAIIALRQGVGRLIRSKSDVGVVVILDKRIAESRYGRKFLKSLPPMLSSRRIQSIPRFLDAAGESPPASPPRPPSSLATMSLRRRTVNPSHPRGRRRSSPSPRCREGASLRVGWGQE